MPLSAEQRQARSDRMKQINSQRAARKFTGAPAVGVTPRSTAEKMGDPDTIPIPPPPPAPVPTGNKWEDLPLEDAVAELARLELELSRARAVVNRRNSATPQIKTLQCWTAIHHKEPIDGVKRAYSQCRKDIPDGKWTFRDDCPIDKLTGKLAPVVTCSLICYQVYMAHRAKSKIIVRQ